jgi:glycosyltransferase domain-containing protein
MNYPHIEDPEVFSLVVPTHNRSGHLRRLLTYLQAIEYPGRIHVVDSSSGAHRAAVEGAQAQFPALWLEPMLYADSMSFAHKLADALGRIGSPLVMLCADDDFVAPRALEQCATFLQQYPDHVAARGKSVAFELRRLHTPGEAGGVEVGFTLQPMHAYPQDDAAARLLAFMHRYSSTLYSVGRRTAVRDALVAAQAVTANPVFFRYLWSCLTAAQGRIWTTPALLNIRQQRAAGPRADYERWPLLITAPGFADLYAAFRAALAGWITARAPATDAAAFGHQLDRAAIDLFRHGYCGDDAWAPDEAGFFNELNRAASPESGQLRAALDLARDFPDTW